MPPIVYHNHLHHQQQANNNDHQLHSCYAAAAAANARPRAPSPLPPRPTSEEPGGWSTLQSQLSPFDAAAEIRSQPRKPLYRIMTERSLAMCTEILGSETGADIFESDELYSLVVSMNESVPAGSDKQADESCDSSGSRRKNNNRKKSNLRRDCSGFPPPLTTMRGPACRQLTCRREGGRLVVAAADVLSKQSFREVEASSGRLKMFFYTNKGNTGSCSGADNNYDGGDKDNEAAAAAGTVREENTTEEEADESEAEGGGRLGVDQVEMGMKNCVAAAGAAGRSCKEGGQGISEIFGIPVHNSKLCLYS